jgi:hypothetical protein
LAGSHNQLPRVVKAAPAFHIRQGQAGRGRGPSSWTVMSHSPSVCRNFESLPLFATDQLLGAALLGPDRAQEFRQMVPMLEARGMPKIDHLMGGRYTRAVIAWFDHQYGLDRGANVLLAPDGVEDFDGCKRRSRRPA